MLQSICSHCDWSSEEQKEASENAASSECGHEVSNGKKDFTGKESEVSNVIF